MVCEKCADSTDDTVSFYHIGSVPMVLCIQCYREIFVKQAWNSDTLEIEIIDQQLKALTNVHHEGALQLIDELIRKQDKYTQEYDKLTLRWLKDGPV